MPVIAGAMLHAVGASCAALCYTPQKKLVQWSWQTYWLAQATVCWLVLPFIVALITIPAFGQVLREAPTGAMWNAFLLGVAYGVGGTAFGMAIRYVGFSLTYAIAVGISCVQLGELLNCPQLTTFTDTSQWFTQRDQIKEIIAACIKKESTEHWISILEPADVWCGKVLDYDLLVKEKGYQTLNMELIVKTSNGLSIKTTRCPIRFDGELLTSEKGAPLLGEHNVEIEEQFKLD